MEFLKRLNRTNFTPHNFLISNVDTDSIAFRKADQKAFTEEEQETLLSELNSLMPEKIKWDHDGVYRRFIVLKAKNYLLDDGKNIKIKGSALKATMKEPALQKFIGEVLELLRTDRKAHIFDAYHRIAQQILNVTKDNIREWCAKKTVTKSVLNPERTTERRILDAIKDANLNEGDKFFVFFKTEEELCLMENFDGTYCKFTLLGKLFDTIKIFSNILDIELFPNYSLKKNRKLLGLETE